jgi:Domain of unknown function (DUF4389)
MTESPEQPPQPQQPPQPERPEPPAAEPPPPRPGTGLDVTPSNAEVAYPNFPLQFDVGYQQEYHRWLPLVKWLLAIPHFIVLFFIWIGALLGIIGAFFAVLFTRRYPEGIFNFVVGASRWTMRVSAYYLLLVDKYPPFSLDDDPDYPVRFNVDYPPNGEISRWRPFFAWILVIPQLFIVYFALLAAYVCVIIGFFAILFTKQFPRGLFDFVVNATRYQLRANAYAYWLTEKYPGFAWG